MGGFSVPTEFKVNLAGNEPIKLKLSVGHSILVLAVMVILGWLLAKLM